jgi:hypothetical protein
VDSQNQHPVGDSTGLPPGRCEGAPSNPGRRRFGRVGAGASGIILTLASEPGMATTMCKSPSGSLSGSLSQHGGQTVVCGGRSCTWWRDNPSQWPSGCVAQSGTGSETGSRTGTQATTFASLFPYGTTDLLRTGSCMDVLKNTDESKDPHFLGAHLVAAYLNCKSGKISFLTPTKVQGMWHDLVLYGHYAPTAGTKWGRYDMSTYLATTELL